jgi:hypothetical protein
MHRQLPFRPSMLVVGFLALLGLVPALTADAQDATPMAAARPSVGFELHIDAKAHFPGDPAAIAHHYCKAVAGGMFECLLFASDDPDAPLVGIEVVVDTATFEGFDEAEQKLWHYHKEEIPLVDAQLPDLSAEEAADVVAMLEETYGKLYLLWDPTAGDLPIGQPFVPDVHAMVAAAGTPSP